MTDGGDAAWKPWQPGDTPDAVDRTIAATRRLTFPFFGLDPNDPRD
jgi:acetoin utilization protein AcuC